MRINWLENVENAITFERRDIVIITADLGFGVFENFERKFPKNFINCGVSEQNMIGIAAGLALRGKKVFCYSIGNFPTLRCLEQIRNDVCYHNLDVCIVTVGAGFGYGQLGMSHHATEDLSIMRCIPNLSCYIPHDSQSTEMITKRIISLQKPSYLRLERSSVDGAPLTDLQSFENPILLGKGPCETLILSCGGITEEAVKLRHKLNAVGMKTNLMVIQSFEDCNIKDVLSAFAQSERIVSIEENVVVGGLGAWASELITRNGIKVRMFTYGLNDTFTSLVGDQRYLRKECGIDSETVFADLIMEIR